MAETTYPTPTVTVDLTIFALVEDVLRVLLIQRRAEPFAGDWALPGGYIHTDEDADIETAARRVLRDKTAVDTPYLEQVQTIGGPDRDPRGWTVSVAYMALISSDEVPQCGANATDVAWWPVDGEIPKLAFDHGAILATATARLRAKVEYTTLPTHLLPARFTLPDLQLIYERLLGRKMDKSAFRKRIAEADFLEAIPGEKQSSRANLSRQAGTLDHLLRPHDLTA
jgi:ADP-ribose pyrophosphatase YjhB (NUDIX family)